MTRRTLRALAVGAAAGLAAGILISRDDGDLPGADTDAKTPFSLGASRSDAAASGPSSTPGVATDRSAANSKRASEASGFAQRTKMYAQAAAAGEAEIVDLIGQARAHPDGVERVAALEILLVKLAETDTPAAVRLALESERADALRLLGALAMNAPEAVWTELLRVSDPLARMEFQTAALEAWVIKDPAEAFGRVAALPREWSREQLLRQAAWGAARSDPQGAIELVRSLPVSEREPLYLAVVDQWSRQDPGAAAQWIESLPVRMQGQLAYRIAGAFLAQQPDAALAWALRISRTPSRNLWSHMIGLMAMHDPERALQLAQAAENPAQRAQAMARVVATIAVRDPAVAMTYIQKMPFGNARSEALAQTAMQIARTRPDFAVEWLRELDEHDKLDGAASAMAAELASSDVDGAARLIDRVPENARPHWIREVALAYADSDPKAGVDWIEKWRDEEPQLVTSFMQRVAMRNPDEALALVERVADDRTADQVMTQVLGMLAMQAPEAAARQIDRIRDESARSRTAQGLAASWAQHDEQAARKWARSLESGRVRDSALSGVAPHIHELDEALEVIGDIQSAEQQLDAVVSAAWRRGLSDPDAMRTLLRRYPLDPQRQQQLDSMLRERKRW